MRLPVNGLVNSYSAPTENSAFLADLLDDFTPQQMVSLLNWLAVNAYVVSRANVKAFRIHNGMPKI